MMRTEWCIETSGVSKTMETPEVSLVSMVTGR